MNASSSGIGLVPEQAWENPDLPASPYGTDAGDRVDRLRPRVGGRLGITADLGTVAVRPAHAGHRRGPPGRAAGHRRRPVRGPPAARRAARDDHRHRHVAGAEATVTVTGRTAPGAGGRRRHRRPTSPPPPPGSPPRRTAPAAFRATVAVGFLTNVLTVTAARGDDTGYARTTVVSEALPGPAAAGRDRPGRRRQRPRHVRLPDRGRLPRRRVRHRTVPGHRRRRHRLPARPSCATSPRPSARRWARSCSMSTSGTRPRRRSPPRRRSRAGTSASPPTRRGRPASRYRASRAGLRRPGRRRPR